MATAAGHCRLSGGRSAGSMHGDTARRIREAATRGKGAFIKNFL